jgi:hypothetical protein
MVAGENCLPPEPLILDFQAPTGPRKLLFGLSLFGFLILAFALIGGLGTVWFGTFVLCMGLGALGIDYVRLHTGWHPVVQSGAYLILFLVALTAFVSAVVLYEVVGIM